MAQAGVPFTTGFLAKLAVIEAAVSHLGAAGATLGVVAMLATAIGAYFYLRVVVLCYSGPRDAEVTAPAATRSTVRLAAVGAGILVDDDRDGGTESRAADTTGDVAMPDAAPVPMGTAVVIGLCVVPTVVFGIWAGPLAELATRATMLFHP